MMHQARVFFMQGAAAFIFTLLLAPLAQAQPGISNLPGAVVLTPYRQSRAAVRRRDDRAGLRGACRYVAEARDRS